MPFGGWTPRVALSRNGMRGSGRIAVAARALRRIASAFSGRLRRLAGTVLPFVPPGVSVSDNLVAPIPPPAVDGVVFPRERSRTERSDGQRVEAGSRQAPDAPPSAPSPFLALLPILLPPAPDAAGAPFELPHPLYHFQGEGVAWLMDRDAALLADDMGLGKTVQAITALRYRFRSGEAQRALVVCPKSVQTGWARHFREWAPELEAIVVAGTIPERQEQWRALQGDRAHVGIITYGSLARDIEQVKDIPLDVLVLDEAQNIKNSATQQARAVRQLEARARWGLSGTPLENRVEDILTILRTLDPDTLPADWQARLRRAPTRRFANSLEELREMAQTPYRPRPRTWDEVHARFPELPNTLRHIMLRRRKDDVLDLPPIHSTIEYLQLTDEQRQAYDLAEREGVARLRDGTTVPIEHILALITQLKQICNDADGYSAKLDWLEDHLDIVVDEKDKALVVSQYVKTLQAIEPRIRRFNPLLYTGSMATKARDDAVTAFQDDASRHAMLLSLKAGGTGLTLTAASRVIHFDSWWNPAVIEQATARVHRIGQKKPVLVTFLVTKDTIEERIQEILDRKRELFGDVVDALSTDELSGWPIEDLYGLFDLEPPPRRMP